MNIWLPDMTIWRTGPRLLFPVNEKRMRLTMSNAIVLPNPSLVDRLEQMARTTRVFVSMPYVDGITPRVLLDHGQIEASTSSEIQRCHGTFAADKLGLSIFDHGALYGDAVFEGVLIVRQGLFQWQEHLHRLYASAERLHIEIPYDPVTLTEHILETVKDGERLGLGPSYIRLVVTRGIGDLGINPAKCAGSTVYCIVSSIELYPEELYETGIRLSISKKIRRAGIDVLPPQIKSCNYLNNILALLETRGASSHETIMLTQHGFIAEATTDNIFVVSREPGWENTPSRVRVSTPFGDYCLNGITRRLVLDCARQQGFQVEESRTMVAEDLWGENREVFLTGTAAGLVPVVTIDGHLVGDGLPGAITQGLRRRISSSMTNPDMSLHVHAERDEVLRYLNRGCSDTVAAAPSVVPVSEDLIIDMFQKIDSRDFDSLRQVFCEDIVYERPGYEPLVGCERVLKFYRVERVIASGKHHLERIVVNQESGACWGRFVGMHKNDSGIDERFADAYLFSNGKIKTRKSYFFRPAV
jgi:branched-chain amino acid aminotransferase